MIPYGKQDISQADIDSVVEVLKSSHLTQGNAGVLFENKLAKICAAKYAVSFCNATAALHSACLALGITKEDMVWTSPISFVASANCALYCNANIDFVDIDINTANICPNALAIKLSNIKSKKALPKVLIVVHMAGQSAAMRKLSAICKEYGIKIIEDASHAIGGQYEEKSIGCCLYSDITIFSFHPVKIITTGEGGAALTNNRELADKLILFRSHGVTQLPNLMENNEGPWYYEQVALGHNYRMTDIQAALGVSQLNRLDDFITQRHSLANQYDNAFNRSIWQPLTQLAESFSAYHLYIVRNTHWTKEEKRKIFIELRDKGIQVHVHYIPIHLQPYYQKLGFKLGDYPSAERYYHQALTLPLHPYLADKQQQYIINSLLDLS